jgi:hypothetical protein
MDIRTAIFLPAVLAAVVACSGGGSGGSDDANNAIPANNANNDVLTGQFVDSPVAGLSYHTETQSGVTSATGEFKYRPGETVVFGLGDLKFPAVAAAHILTPLELAGSTNLTDTGVVNMARLLQSLDQDCNPDNGITISGEALLSAVGMSLNFSDPNFDTTVVNLVANGGQNDPACRVLIDGDGAIAHLRATLEALDALPAPIGNGLSGKVGVWEGEGQQSGISWTIKIVINEDRQTIEYPSLACGGDLALISETDNQLLFKETITYGHGCVNKGYVELTDQSVNELAYRWYQPISGEFTSVDSLKIGAIGTVRKTE